MLASQKREARLTKIAERLAAERAMPKPGEFPLAPALCELWSLPEGYLVDADSFGKLLVEKNVGKKLLKKRRRPKRNVSKACPKC